tara:strand:+ start:1401 stop:2090 length:690 start_codon:yes stop_codon:yes gene_type:complete
MNKYIVETKNLKKTFSHDKKKIKILENVNFSIKPGELVALTGPSGSGKSSFLHMLALLEKPSSGYIYVLGKEIKEIKTELKNIIRQKNISIIFQNHNLLSDFTVMENVLMPLIIKEENINKSIEKVNDILRYTKILDRKKHFPNELSGGEQQRVAIARSLVAGTDLVLADEPTGNLDRKTSLEIFELFKKLKKLNKAILFATHNRELANLADYKLSISNCNIKRTNGKK